MITKQLIVPTLAGAAMLLGLPFQSAFAVNWDSVKPYGMTLFYPGQASLELVVAPNRDLDIQLAVANNDIVTQAYSVKIQP